MTYALSLARSQEVAAQYPRALARWLRHAVVVGSLSAFACSGQDGTPSLTCADGKLACDNECTDVTSSLLHCGGCDRSCATNQDCVRGQCTCVGELSACASGCVDLQGNAQNCGECGRACEQGLVCSKGSCSSSCQDGREACGSDCVDTRKSSSDCGGCGKACKAGQICSDGVCECTQERVLCGDSCVNTADDRLNCGKCNNECTQGDECRSGSCQATASGTGGASGGEGGMSSGTMASSAAPTGGRSSTKSASGGSNSGGSDPGSGGKGSGGANTGGSSTSTTTAVGVGTGGGSSGSCSRTGFYVENKALYDKNCNEFILRGINYPYAWFSTRSIQQDFTAIAGTGANSVRVVMSTGARWTRTTGSTLTSIINAAKSAKLVVVAEVHDTTGWSEQSGSVALTNATQYWSSSDIVSALKGQEAYVIVNIGNEPMGNSSSNQWASAHVTAVQALRTAGLKHMLMVDAPNWGQDWENKMRDGGGSSIWTADSEKNLVFSVHMYDVYSSSQTVSTYMNTFLSKYEAPLVIGEFAADHGGGKNIDEDSIMSNAESLGIGYLGWSWAGNGSDLATLNITNNFSASSLSTWGNRLINGTNGIKATSKVCTCFN